MLSPSSRVKITAICKVKGEEPKGSEVESQNGMDKFARSLPVLHSRSLQMGPP